MADWLILVEIETDLKHFETPHTVMKTSDYLANSGLFAGRRPFILNLSRTYSYQSKGYYASLLAEARGHRAVPAVQTMVELAGKTLYAQSLPELSDALAKELAAGAKPRSGLFIAFGKPTDPAYAKLAKLAMDWFRTPALYLEFDLSARPKVKKITAPSINTLKEDRRAFFVDAMQQYTQSRWTAPKTRAPSRWSLAVLIDPEETLPASDEKSLKRLHSVAAKMGVAVEPIYPNDLAKLAQYDALFIRANTSIDNYTYRFARRAEQEGMPVIDDTISMIRCTNKVYLKEILDKAGLPGPKTEILDAKTSLTGVLDRLGSPVVLKAPDGSFSRSVYKVDTLEALQSRTKEMFKETALVLAQEFMPTDFDWRIGVLGGEPLFACKYKMARGHWQIVRHQDDGTFKEGGAATLAVEAAPAEVVDLAVKAARLIGDGFYGVDIKQNAQGTFVIEVNDNPNAVMDVEGAVLKDELWVKLITWFTQRLEQRIGGTFVKT